MAAAGSQKPYLVGSWVWSLYEGEWYEAEIVCVNDDGTYAVYYHEWDFEEKKQPAVSLQPWVQDKKPTLVTPKKNPRLSLTIQNDRSAMAKKSSRERRKASRQSSLSPAERTKRLSRAQSRLQTARSASPANETGKEGKKQYLLSLAQRGFKTNEVEYFTPSMSSKGTGNVKAREMSSDGITHGTICDGAIVTGIPWSDDEKYLNLGDGRVPILDQGTGECDTFTNSSNANKQALGITKLLPMEWLEEVNLEKLIGCSVIAKWDNASRREAIIEGINLDGNICVAWLTSTKEASVSGTTTNISPRRLLMVTAGVRRRYVVKKDSSPAVYKTTKDEKALLPLDNHGTIDEGMVVLGKKIMIDNITYVDVGTGTVPTGPSNVGKQDMKARKLLPFSNLTVLEAESLVGLKVRARWKDGFIYSDIAVDKSLSAQSLSVRRLSILGYAAQGPQGCDKDFQVSSVVQVLGQLSTRENSLLTTVSSPRRKSHRASRVFKSHVYEIEFSTPSLGLKFAPHGDHGLPTVQKNERKANNPDPYVGDLVVAVNGIMLEDSNDPYGELFKLAGRNAARPLKIKFRRDLQNSISPSPSKKNPSEIVKSSIPAPPPLPAIATDKNYIPTPPAPSCPTVNDLNKSLTELIASEALAETDRDITDHRDITGHKSSSSDPRTIPPSVLPPDLTNMAVNEDSAHIRSDSGFISSQSSISTIDSSYKAEFKHSSLSNVLTTKSESEAVRSGAPNEDVNTSTDQNSDNIKEQTANMNLYTASGEGDLTKIKALLTDGADPNWRNNIDGDGVSRFERLDTYTESL